MSIALVVLLALHGIAHLVGFVVPWQLTRSSRDSYKTTIIGGRDVGRAGTRFIGIFYLLLAIAFVVMAVAVYQSAPWWRSGTLFVTGMSLFMCVVNWPDTKIGLAINIVIIAYLTIGA